MVLIVIFKWEGRSFLVWIIYLDDNFLFYDLVVGFFGGRVEFNFFWIIWVYFDGFLNGEEVSWFCMDFLDLYIELFFFCFWKFVFF